MSGHRSTVCSPDVRTWLELAVTAPVVLWAGWPFFQRWAASVANRSPNMWTPIGTGVGAVFGYSLVASVAPDLFPASFHEHGRVAVCFEAAAIIVPLTLLGQVVELEARSNTSAALKALLGLSPKMARRLRSDGVEADIPLTRGRPAFREVIVTGDVTADEVIRLAASLDQGSEHPLADAIVAEARQRGLVLSPAAGFESVTGLGARGQVSGRSLAIGNVALMRAVNADVGIAMGTGTDVAMSSAQVTLVKGDLRGIARARQISQAAVTNMRQNLAFAFLYNALGVPIAAGVLYPAFGVLLSPMLAALAMSLSSASLVGYALRLRHVSPS